MKTAKILKAAFLFSFILVTVAVMAQPGGGGMCDGSPFQPASCPIDGGVSLLVAAGALLGGKKAFDMTKKGS